MTGLLTGIGSGLLDLIYPPRCRTCDAEIGQADLALELCETCIVDLVCLPRERCPACGKINLKRKPDRSLCFECRSGLRRFDRAISVYVYAGAFRKLWHRVKFTRHPEWIPSIVDAALEKLTPDDEFNPFLFDAYTWVPTTDHRKSVRGFDPAEEIAGYLARKYNRPIVQFLRRIRDTAPQFELGRRARIKNVEGVFAAAIPAGQRTRAVLLIDDILTTGATASACADALKSRGVQKVVLFTLARGA
ncbi:ComF family protein [bacterium]|nr:ComF family protein [bacterium]